MTYSSEMYGREAARLIDAHATSVTEHNSAESFFLYLAFQDCHSPYSAPQQYLSRFPDLKAMRLTFNAMISAVDDAVGMISEALDRHPTVYKGRTVIVFSGDNGGPAKNANNWPLVRTILHAGAA